MFQFKCGLPVADWMCVVPVSATFISSTFVIYFSFSLSPGHTFRCMCSQLQDFVIVANDTICFYKSLLRTLYKSNECARVSLPLSRSLSLALSLYNCTLHRPMPINLWIKCEFCSWINVNRCQAVKWLVVWVWITLKCIFNVIQQTLSFVSLLPTDRLSISILHLA